MSIKEIIRILEDGDWWDSLDDYIEEKRNDELCDEVDAAITLLRTHPDAQPNEPLTLAKLQEMDGRPVWVNIAPGSWGLVDIGLLTVFTRFGDVDLRTAGATGKLYLCLPKED